VLLFIQTMTKLQSLSATQTFANINDAVFYHAQLRYMNDVIKHKRRRLILRPDMWKRMKTIAGGETK
jgi:hypothetical protein